MDRGLPLVERSVRIMGRTRPGTDETVLVASEEPLALELNGHQVAVLMRLAGMEKELAVGFCVSEGLLYSPDDIMLLQHCGQGLPVPGESESQPGQSRNRVRITALEAGVRIGAQLDVTRLIRAGCGRVDALEDLDLVPLPAGPCYAEPMLLGLAHKMRDAQVLHRRAGGLHAAGLYDALGERVALAEDIGRHNALDKVAGRCLLQGIPLADKVLISTGRLSYEMAAKAVRLGLPVLISVTAPTALAVETADRFNLTLIGYARAGRMTVYCHPERIAATD